MLIQLLIIQIITFIGVVFLLQFLFSSHLKSALSRLNLLHEENLVKEEELNAELKRAKEESQAQVQRGKEDAELIIEEANKESGRLRLDMEAQAKAQAAKIITEGQVEAERIKLSVVKNIQAQSIELACKLIGELLTEIDKAALQYEFANNIIQEISLLPQEQFSIKSSQAKVTSSFPLLESQRQELTSALSNKMGNHVELIEELNVGLIGGLTVEVGGMIIDGTLKNKLQRIIAHLK